MIINDKRELAYTVNIDSIEPIVGSDNCECAIVGGWRVMVHKGEFKPGDRAVYFEIDSKVPSNNPAFEFLSKKNWKIKTQRYTFGGKGLMISQGLVMPVYAFEKELGISKDTRNIDLVVPLHLGLTDTLGVTYAVEEDNKRKADSFELACQSMTSRRKELFKKPWAKWMMKRAWGRKVMFFLFGKKRDNPRGFPKGFPYVHKTDEERVENMPWVLEDKSPLILTEKLDGTSCTYILERKPFGKFEFYVSSRNVRQLKPEQETWFGGDSNIYWELAFKYDIENKLKDYLKNNPQSKYVCIQGEGVGNVQGNPLKLKENRLFVFNFIDSELGRIRSDLAKDIVKPWGLEWVPIIQTDYVLPDTMEEFKLFADGMSVVNPECRREGFVLRNPETDLSFKNVSREYLLNKGE